MKKSTLTASLIASCVGLFAQTADSLKTQNLNTIEISGVKTINEKSVTISKMPVKPMDLPQAVTIIDQTTIQDQQAQRLSDVVKNVNGVYLGGMRASTQETFYARGYNLGSTNTFKNGFRINNGTMPEMSSIESVEFLKGSAALLYGNVAPGGIINMITKQPMFKFGGAVEMRAGSFTLHKPSVDIYGPISKNIAYRVNGTYEYANSYRDVVHSERSYINPSFLFNLGKKTTLIVQGDYLKYNFTPDFGIGTLSDQTNVYGGKIIPNVSRSAFFGARWQYAKMQQSTSSFQLTHKINNSWTFNALGGYQNYYRDYFSVERIQLNKNGDFKRPLGKNLIEQNYYTGQIFVNGNFNTGRIKHTSVIGVDFEQDNTTTYTSNLPANTIYDKINIFDLSVYKERTDMPQYNWVFKTLNPITRTGAYVQDLITLSDKFKVLAGMRWSFQQADKSIVTTFATNSTKKAGITKIDKAFSPRLGLVYQPTKTTAVFASYSNSFTPNTGLDKDSATLRPSIIDQYEVGIKNDFFNGLLSTNVTAYRIINNNLAQPLQYLKNGIPTYGNTILKELSGQTISDGVELDVRVRPTKELTVIAGYSFNNMFYTKTAKQKGSYVSGVRLVNTPANTANATAFYTFHNGIVKGLKLGTGVYYVGERNAGWNDTYIDSKGTKSNLLYKVKGFTTVDVSAGYTYKRWSAMFKLANITNELNYYIHENYSINPIPPRNYVFTLAYRF